MKRRRRNATLRATRTIRAPHLVRLGVAFRAEKKRPKLSSKLFLLAARDLERERGRYNESARAYIASLKKKARELEPSTRLSDKEKRENPDLLTISNPSNAALSAFQKFHGHTRPKVIRARGPAGGPHTLIALGDLKEIRYVAKAPSQRKGSLWCHKFKKGAKLASDPSGKHLFILRGEGSRVRVDWERGILH